jgi:hypothetical protein
MDIYLPLTNKTSNMITRGAGFFDSIMGKSGETAPAVTTAETKPQEPAQAVAAAAPEKKSMLSSAKSYASNLAGAPLILARMEKTLNRMAEIMENYPKPTASVGGKMKK